ncbi:MAG: pyridoxamine 5'-phosphate oxidase family protein [Desulfobacteraceae bacterium]
MELKEYFANATGHGILATADAAGRVNLAMFAKPHIMDDHTIAFIMPHRLTHNNLQANPHAAYLFMESGPGYQGKRMHLTKVREEQDSELLHALRRRSYAREGEKPGPRFLVFFQVIKMLPLVGPGPEV